MAQLTWWTAEMNRSREQQPEPYELGQFFCFAPATTREGPPPPPPDAGAAALALLGADLLPPWAMGWVDDLADVAENQEPPEVWALMAGDALLLAPRPAPGGGWRGYLLAEPMASGLVREFRLLPDGELQELQVPKLPGEESGQAVAGATLTIPAPDSEPD